jgi:hypothetical protein
MNIKKIIWEENRARRYIYECEKGVCACGLTYLSACDYLRKKPRPPDSISTVRKPIKPRRKKVEEPHIKFKKYV